MQPLAMWALALGVIMAVGALGTLAVTRRDSKRLAAGISRWHLHGSLPLAVAGLMLGAISRDSGQSHATHTIVFMVASALLLDALLCAVVGAVNETRHRRTAR